MPSYASYRKPYRGGVVDSGLKSVKMCLMGNHPSTTTLLVPAEVAEVAGVSVPTIYDWIRSGIVKNTFDVSGRPVFTQQEAQQVAVLVQERRALKDALRLPVSA